MNQEQTNIKSELEGLSSSLSRLDKSNPFRVPKRYFENLSDQIIDKAALSEISTITEALQPDIAKRKQQDVPKDYFEKLQNNILGKVAEEELSGLPESVIKLRRSNPFKVPENYFDSLQSSIDNRIEKPTRKRAKFFSLFNPTLGLIAAALTGIILTFIFLEPKKNEASFAALDNQEVYEYLEEHISEFSEEDLFPLITEVGFNLNESPELLNEDIEEYLNEVGEDLEVDFDEIL